MCIKCDSSSRMHGNAWEDLNADLDAECMGAFKKEETIRSKIQY